MFVSELEDWVANSVSLAERILSNSAWRNFTKPWFITYAEAHCATNPAMPRTPNSSSRDAGIIHKSTPSFWNPRSSNGFSNPGINGSVAELMTVAATTSATPPLEPLKYGQMRASLEMKPGVSFWPSADFRTLR